MEEIRIEAYRPELRSELLALQQHHWGEDLAANDAYFAWKYEQNPYCDEPLVWIARKRRDIIGMRGAYGVAWQVLSEELSALAVGDLVVRPEDRNRFVPRRIMEAAAHDLADRGWRYLLSLSAGRFTQLASLRQGWRRVVLHAPARFRGQGIRRLVMRLAGRPAVAFESCPFRSFDRGVRRGERRRPQALAVETEARPKEMAELRRTTDPRIGVRHRRDESFFAWRFRNPFSHYRFLFWEQERPPLGAYLVLQDGTRRDAAGLVDWAYTSSEAFSLLVRQAVELLGRRPCATWFGTLDRAERRLFERAGFAALGDDRDRRYRPALLVKDLHPDGSTGPYDRIFDPRAWRYQMVDSDRY